MGHHILRNHHMGNPRKDNAPKGKPDGFHQWTRRPSLNCFQEGVKQWNGPAIAELFSLHHPVTWSKSNICKHLDQKKQQDSWWFPPVKITQNFDKIPNPQQCMGSGWDIHEVRLTGFHRAVGLLVCTIRTPSHLVRESFHLKLRNKMYLCNKRSIMLLLWHRTPILLR